MKTNIPPALITFALICFGFSPMAKALLPAPSPDGAYPGANTAEGINALHNVNTAVGINNTAVGANALAHDTIGYSNVGVGFGALAGNTTGNFNMAIGTEALTNNNGNFNVAIGFRAGYMNTSGARLTGIGAGALRNNTWAIDNTAVGADALRENTTGAHNTAIGVDALKHNNNFSNTATGDSALFSNTIGINNTANGFDALYSNITGEFNTATGDSALFSNTTGIFNTANGVNALLGNTTGSENTADGVSALVSNTTGHSNTALGFGAGNNVTTSSDVICIGANVRGENVSSTTWIGGVYGVTTQSGTTAPVVVSDGGQLGTIASSERFKKDIATMDKTSEAILSLRPVTFHYKTDTKGTPQFGLIAEEVAKVNPALVLPDKDGKPYTVRYEAVNAMLLNEFLKEHRKVEKQEATIAQLKQDFQSKLAEQQTQIERLTAGLQKVSAELATASPSRGGLEASKLAMGGIRGDGPAPQLVNNNP
jgi:Chaperone of endosialidase